MGVDNQEISERVATLPPSKILEGVAEGSLLIDKPCCLTMS